MRAIHVVVAALPILLMILQDPVRPIQDPTRARPPRDAPPLPPVPEPYRTPLERRDLLQRFVPTSPIEGVYELRAVVRGGRTGGGRSRGYLSVGRQHLSLHLVMDQGRGGPPVLQSGFRRYQLSGSTMTMTGLLGYQSNGAKTVALERPGVTQTRQIERVGPLLRIKQARGDYLEFRRIE